MKASAIAGASAPSFVSDVLVLMKLRLNSLVVFTTAAGYYMEAGWRTDWGLLAATCAGTALVASGAAGLNQVSERDVDALMLRTRTRPLADGRMTPATGRAISGALIVIGLALLAAFGGAAAAIVALVTCLTYILIYTPMKRRTSLATIVGAIPGALPPMIGWAAAGGSLAEPGPWSLFLLMFCWQLPHFLAISWLYRDDYAKAGLPMLAVIDSNGALTGRQAAFWAATLIPVTLIPASIGMANASYGVGALVLGIAQLMLAFRFALDRSRPNAKALFLASITYLPLLWILMATARR